mmetsp:Transcript_17504/g.24142  ORF Transcript_17504/g.24142 Transcript_17504/m.24142 type:complete len:534 (-) Transcript_17504:22-1623(-)
MAERHIKWPSSRILNTLVVLILLTSSTFCYAFVPISTRGPSQTLSPIAKQPIGRYGEGLMSQRWRPSFFANNEPSLSIYTSTNMLAKSLSPSPTSLFLVPRPLNRYPSSSSTKALLSLAFATTSLSKSPAERGERSLFGAATNSEESEEGKKLSPFQKAVTGIKKAIVSVLRFFFVKPLLWLKSLFSSTDVTEKDDTEEAMANATATDTVVTEVITEDVETQATAGEPAEKVEPVKIVSENVTAADESVVLKTAMDEAQNKVDTEKKDEEAFLTTTENLAVDEDDSDGIPYFANVVERAVATAKDAMAVIEKGVTSISEAEKVSEKVDEVVSEKEDEAPTEKQAPLILPKGERWAVSHPDIDLSGDWKVVVSDGFKSQYDDYLRSLGQPQIVRSVALSIIGMTREHTSQKDDGRELFIKGTNARGLWERTLKASGSDFDGATTNQISIKEDKRHERFPLVTADSENVEAEAWWENNGTVHTSWLRGGKKYGGGDFESKRYLEGDGKYLVCESKFHPEEEGREESAITWRFERI